MTVTDAVNLGMPWPPAQLPPLDTVLVKNKVKNNTPPLALQQLKVTVTKAVNFGMPPGPALQPPLDMVKNEVKNCTPPAQPGQLMVTGTVTATVTVTVKLGSTPLLQCCSPPSLTG